MSKYIDAEKLKAEIERRKNQTERRIDNIVPIRRKDTMDEEQLAKIELRDKVDKAYLNGVLITLSDILSSVISLQQEQPTKGYDEKYLNEKIAKAKKSWDGVDVDEFMDDVRGREQPEGDLEKEIDDWYNTMGIPITADALKETARHFYELGLNARKEE